MIHADTSDMLIKVDTNIKEQAESVLSSIGLTFNDAVNLMLRQISLKRKIPFELSDIPLTENGYTPEFEAEILAERDEIIKSIENGTAKLYNSADEVFAALNAETRKSVLN